MKRNRHLASAVALILAANALYAPYLTRIMMCDEANTYYQYAQSLPRALLSYATPNNHILHSALVWLVTNLAGSSPVAVRFVALAGALLSVALLYRVTTRTAGVRAALAACTFLITTYDFADYSVNARGYTLSIALTLLLIDRVFLTRHQDTRGYRYSLLVICCALILLLPSMLMLIGAVAVWILWQARTQQQRALLIPLIIGVALAALFYLPSFLHSDLFTTNLALFGERDLVTLGQLWLIQIFGTPGIGLVFAVSCLIGIAVVLRYPRARAICFTLLGMTIVIAIAQMLILHKVFFARNYLFLIAPVALLGGIGFSWIAKRWTAPLITLILFASVIPLQALDGDYLEKQVVERVEQNIGAHDQIIVGPCFNAPVQYTLLHNGEGNKLFASPKTERIFVLTNLATLEDTLDMFGMGDRVKACQPVTDGSWDPFEVYTCQPRSP